MGAPSRWGLTARAICLCLALLLGTVGVLGTALIWRSHRDASEDLTAHAVVHTRSIAHAAEPAVLLDDREGLRRILNTAAQDRDVREVEIVDGKEELVASLHRPTDGDTEIRIHPGTTSDAASCWRRLLAERGEFVAAQRDREDTPTSDHEFIETSRERDRLAVLVPIWRHTEGQIDLGILEDQPAPDAPSDQPVGFVRITYSLGRLRAALADRLLFSALALAGVILLGVGVTIPAVQQMTKPLRNLVDVTAAIARGDRKKRAATESFGEIGELARSFNHMAERLEESYASIEKKVADRTAELRVRTQELESEVAERQRAEQQTRQQAALLKAINAVFQETLACQTEEETARVCLDKAQELTGSAFGFIGEVNANGRVDTIALSSPAWDACELPRAQAARLLQDMPIRGIWGTILTEQKAQIINRPETHPARVGTPSGHPRITAFLGVPLRRAGRVTGVIALANKPGGYNDRDRQQLESLAVAFGEALSRERAELRLREHAALLEAKNRELEAQRNQLHEQQSELLETNRALEEARIAAEAASRAKSLFLANMSHEIRTPMTAILGFAENMLDPRLSASEKLDAVNTIRRNGGHLLQIINDILDISKIEAGRLVMERVSCSPERILADVASLMRPHAKAKNLTFRIEYAGSVPETIHTDPTRLRQILINLVGNAIKFTERGGVTVRIALRETVDEGSTVVEPGLSFDVVDTGLGMSAKQIRSVFHPFTQADETMSRRFGGTGLGLTISRRLAEKLGGGITVESTPGKGSTFRLTVATGPLERVNMLTRTNGFLTTDESAMVEPATMTDTLDCRVLLAEDGPDNQRLIAHLLRKVGADVAVAENGRVAVDMALAAHREERPFDIILMDMQMPVMDGYGATSLLRTKGYAGKIIALTAHAMSTDRDKCLRAGCNEFATKPIDRNALIELIRRVVSGTSIVALSASE